MRSFLSFKRLQLVNFICLIVILFLLIMNCSVRQFGPQKKDSDANFEGQNLIPNGNIEILDNGLFWFSGKWSNAVFS